MPNVFDDFSVINLPVLFGNIKLERFKLVLGKTNQIMKQGLVSLVIGLPIDWFMVPYFSSIGGASFAVVGGILGTLIAAIPSTAWGLYWCWNNF